jgi:hypothetical protein
MLGMATNGRKKVNIQYRKLEDLTGGFGKHTLQSALSSCLKQAAGGSVVADSVTSRQFEQDKAYGTIVLNYVEDTQLFFFGEIVRFEPGADLPLLQIGTNVKVYNLTQAKAPQGHEPIRGVLYFMAIGNHALILESDVSTGRAETYLSWLLGEATPSVSKGTHVILVAELSAQAGATQLRQVEQVVFKPRPVEAPDASAALMPVTVGATSKDVAETNTLEVLRAAGMDDTDIQKLVQSDTKIEVTLQIKFKGQRRRKPLGIDDANRLLRNIPEDQITLIGPGGRQKEGKIVKLSYPANIELVGSLLNSKDVARALYEGYKYFVSNGYIDG